VTATARPHVQHQRPPLWRNVAFLKWAAQLFALGLVIFVMFLLADEAGDNLEANSVRTSFDFLSEPVGIQIGEGIETRPATGAQALWVGMVNMLRISVVGIVFATVLGVLVGISRLSGNWLVSKVATVYVETIRNIPLLVQIVFWLVVMNVLGPVTFGMGPISGWLHVSQKGLSIPRVFGADGFFQWLTFALVGLAAAWLTYRWRMRVKDRTGQETHPFTWAGAAFLLIAAVGWFAHPLLGWMGAVFGAIADLFDSLPDYTIQVVLAGAAIGAAAWWIRRFLASRRTPAGLAKLTDDDVFRMVFAGIAAGAVAILVLAWPGLASWIGNSLTDLFSLLGRRFSSDNTGAPIGAARPDIVQTGAFPQYSPAGWNMTPAFFAVFVGVTAYTAAFIAEIVRGGILAVPKGQSEAAGAVGLKRGQALRFVVLPQAFRIILPPLGNQYLNLAKNTSLGIAVGYADLVQVGQTIYNQTGNTLQVILIWMLFYLTVSLSISFVVNTVNRSLALVER
jgi:general L-amino acid transport system permease protein